MIASEPKAQTIKIGSAAGVVFGTSPWSEEASTRTRRGRRVQREQQKEEGFFAPPACLIHRRFDRSSHTGKTTQRNVRCGFGSLSLPLFTLLHNLPQMAGRSPSSSAIYARSRSRSPVLLFTLFLIGFSLLFFLFSLSSSTSQSPLSFYPNRPPETSFLISLEHFLTHRSPGSSHAPDDSVNVAANDDAVIRLDDSVCRSESQRLLTDPHYPLNLPLRVYVYEMPPKFTYNLLWLFHNTYKQTSNLTSNGSPVHRLIEQVSQSPQALPLRSVTRSHFLLIFSLKLHVDSIPQTIGSGQI